MPFKSLYNKNCMKIYSNKFIQYLRSNDAKKINMNIYSVCENCNCSEKNKLKTTEKRVLEYRNDK